MKQNKQEWFKAKVKIAGRECIRHVDTGHVFLICQYGFVWAKHGLYVVTTNNWSAANRIYKLKGYNYEAYGGERCLITVRPYQIEEVILTLRPIPNYQDQRIRARTIRPMAWGSPETIFGGSSEEETHIGQTEYLFSERRT